MKGIERLLLTIAYYCHLLTVRHSNVIAHYLLEQGINSQWDTIQVGSIGQWSRWPR